MLGGHVMAGNVVYTTAEVVVGEALALQYKYESDPTYGYDELAPEARTQ